MDTKTPIPVVAFRASVVLLALWELIPRAAAGIEERRNAGSHPAAANGAVRGVEWIKQNRGAVYFQPGEFVSVEVKWSSATMIQGMRLDRGDGSHCQLWDDGTHGDAAAGDGIWSLDSASFYWPVSAPPYKIAMDSKYGCVTQRSMPVKYKLMDGTWENDGFAFVRVGLVDPLTSVDVQKLGNGLWASEYCLFIEDSLQGQRLFPGYPITDRTWSRLMKPASSLLYTHFPDAFDFLLVTPATPVWIPNPVLMERVPNATTVRNSVQGIGLPLFDSAASWGSPARLKTVVYHSFGPFDILSHELGHQWAAYLDSLTFSNGACGVHWAENQTAGGIMSLWPKIVETAPGKFRGVMHDSLDAFNNSFSPLDLYLMGLKPLSEVPLIKRVNNPDYSNPDSVGYTSITTIDPQTFTGRYGQRSPAYPNAQKDFTLATIIVKPFGWTDAEFAFFSILAKHAADSLDDGWGYNYNFEKAAYGLASLESKMFTPTGMPPVPALSAPASGATDQPSSVTLAWNPSGSATSYDLEVSRKPDFTDTVVVRKGVTSTSTQLSSLLAGATYYWRVRATGASGKSRFSSPWSLTTKGSTGVEASGAEIVNEYALYPGYPNPFNPVTTLSFALPHRSHVDLTVFNALGQQVAQLAEGEMEQGIYRATFDATGLSSGVYFCTLRATGSLEGGTKFFAQTRTVALVK